MRAPIVNFRSLAPIVRYTESSHPKRLRDDYTHTGFKGYGVKTRAEKGHEFGLKLSANEKKALIAFLKTL